MASFVGKPGQPPRLMLVVFGVELLWVFYGAFTYSGIYRWLAELSLSVFGSYEVRITFLLALVLLLVPTRILFVRFFPSADAQVSSEELARKTEQANGRLARVQRWGTLGLLGAGAIVLGIRGYLAAEAGATLERTSSARIEAGEEPQSTWLSIEGTPLSDAPVETKESHSQYLYVPLVSEGWTSDKPLRVILRFERDGAHNLESSVFQGGIAEDGLPGMVRERYEQAGVKADGALVLRVGAVPHDGVRFNEIVVGIGLLALLLGGFMTYRRWEPDESEFWLKS
jgi:hypothetical protein